MAGDHGNLSPSPGTLPLTKVLPSAAQKHLKVIEMVYTVWQAGVDAIEPNAMIAVKWCMDIVHR
jgi:hypothetical protein